MTASTRTRLARAETADAGRTRPRVLAVVVTHRGRPWIRETLAALANQDYPQLDVLLVDDASPDHREPPPLRRIAKRHLQRRRWGYLRTPRPLGFGGAANWALSRVRTDADLLLFVHDDAALLPGALTAMVERMAADAETAIVGPKIVAWDDPLRLEEIGMAADRFGYPYKGLEEGEIDLGQHDRSSEVFYVTSTCVLIRHSVFRGLRGWDARMRAFSEDLDLCWRARVSGHSVRVEPEARVRHAIALATGRRGSPFLPARYFIRRNRLRAVTKNASRLRLAALIPQYLLLTIAEMLGFIILRQPREILNLARALLWNATRLPQTLAERYRVQRRRSVPDWRMRRLMVKQTTRIRVYMAHQRDRLEDVWGRRAEVLTRMTTYARATSMSMSGIVGIALTLALLILVVGFRHVLWGSPVAAGDILPFPDRPTALWRAYLSSWQGVGLGEPGPAPTALGLLGFVPVISLGATEIAQKLLLLGLGVAAFAGAAKMLSDVIDRPARIVAGLTYAFGAVGYAGIREGRLGALVLGAAAPFVIRAALRLIGWMRPPAFKRGRAIAQVALGTALSAAFAPGSIFFFAAAAIVLAAARAVLERPGRALRGLVATALGLMFGWALLMPWSLRWFERGGPLDKLTSDETWRNFAASFRGAGMGSIALGQTPEGLPLLGLALPLLGVIAVVVGDGARRRIALGLWAVVGVTGLLVDAIASGWVRPLVASPTEAGVIASAAFAGLAGLAVGAFRLDLSRRGLGWMHALTLGVLGVSAFMAAASLGPAMWSGAWDPGVAAGADDEIVDQVSLFLEGESDEVGLFRTLWIGDFDGGKSLTAARPLNDYVVTGPRGRTLADLFARETGPDQEALAGVIGSVEAGSLDRGGNLLGSFNIGFVVLERGPGGYRWLAQRDLELIRIEPGYVVLRNQALLPRLGVFERSPGGLKAIASGDAAAGIAPAQPLLVEGTQEAAHAYRSEPVTGPAVAVLTEAHHDGWRASVGDRDLERAPAGWANAFAIPSGATGSLEVGYPRTTSDLAWIAAGILAWIVVVGAAFSNRRPNRFERGAR